MAKRSSTPDRLSLPDPFPRPAAWQGSDGAARFSACGLYRWWLVRHWCPGSSAVLFIGLNPSRADGSREDPTLRRLRGQASRWGHGQLLVLNLFSRVSPDPAQLRRCPEPVGELTDAWLATAVGWLAAQPRGLNGPPPRLWLGWGHRGGLHGRDQQVLALLQSWKGEVVCLGETRKGHPRHPLFCRTIPSPLPYVHRSSPCPAFPAATPST